MTKQTANGSKKVGRTMKTAINIIFDGPPEHKPGRFVEVENDLGESIKVGEWIERPDGFWALRITELPGETLKPETKGMDLPQKTCESCGISLQGKEYFVWGDGVKTCMDCAPKKYDGDKFRVDCSNDKCSWTGFSTDCYEEDLLCPVCESLCEPVHV